MIHLVFLECLSGFHFVSNSLCARCPANTYQEKQGQTTCNNCPAKKQTFGKTGMTSKSNCSGNDNSKTMTLVYNILVNKIDYIETLMIVQKIGLPN